MVNLNELGKVIVITNEANGWDCAKPESWNEKQKIPAILALVHSEVSEALEAFRNDDKENFVEEMADVIIRCLDCTAGLGMDIHAAVIKKIEFNSHRGWKHGGKRI